MAGIHGQAGSFTREEKVFFKPNDRSIQKSISLESFEEVSTSNMIKVEHKDTSAEKTNKIVDISKETSKSTISTSTQIRLTKNFRSCISPTQIQALNSLPSYNWDGTDGCITCGADDDHDLLLICEICNKEQHTYCVNPPLDSVPEGDFYCGESYDPSIPFVDTSFISISNSHFVCVCVFVLFICKDLCEPFKHMAKPKSTRPNSSPNTNIQNSPFPPSQDNLEYLICSLPPRYTARFGEIVWAAGGVGFGWWPACIYDPRLTVGNARSLGKRHLGKKHLVYFFECHDAPFATLNENKICPWLEGFQEEYDLGKTAKAMSKSRGALFHKALMIANIEFEKPVELRLDWNHQDDDLNIKGSSRLSPRPQEEIGTTPNEKVQQQNEDQIHQENENIVNTRRKTRSGNLSLQQSPSRIQIGLSRTRRKSRNSSQSLSEDIAKDTNISPAKTKEHLPSKKVALKEALNTPHTKTRVKVKRNNINAVLNSLSSFESENKSREPPVFCTIFLRKPTNNLQESNLHTNSTENESYLYNIGFISLNSSDRTYKDAREAIENEMCENEVLSSSIPTTWKFYAPNLGLMSQLQESQMNLHDFWSATNCKKNAVRSCQNTQRLIVQDFSKGPIISRSIGIQVGSSEILKRRKRTIILPISRNKKRKGSNSNEKKK